MNLVIPRATSRLETAWALWGAHLSPNSTLPVFSGISGHAWRRAASRLPLQFLLLLWLPGCRPQRTGRPEEWVQLWGGVGGTRETREVTEGLLSWLWLWLHFTKPFELCTKLVILLYINYNPVKLLFKNSKNAQVQIWALCENSTKKKKSSC